MPASINNTDTSFFISCFLRGYQVHGFHRKHGAKIQFNSGTQKGRQYETENRF